MRTEPCGKWVRGFVGDTVVVDTRDPLLFWEDRLPVPFYAVPEGDVADGVLQPATGEPPRQPFFFLPQGPVSRWFDVVVGDRRLPHAAWIREDPALAGRVVVSWQPGLLDRWLEEDEVVAGHPRDPYHRVDALPSSRHVTVSVDGTVVADSHHPVLLFETHLPTRYYLPVEDVVRSAVVPADTRSHCPYKGDADRYWDVVGPSGDRLADAAWSYSTPFPAVSEIAGRVAFYNELVDITVDGVPQPRPVSPFSDAENRPS
ncbi:DUF427 domain-containing protein [Nakamurella endophytica]|uniref:DUF427 domain-containing protein n=1 Tax=Nakamurella endophytica TaxID=1748367 RepID=A0A917WEU2_9ACTN|nr:DUF427 domain-containing protein [Nakamurella endophytica]GGL99002.1 hypothetical protein GCM10011594_18700 [Nakamurella endophytica]